MTTVSDAAPPPTLDGTPGRDAGSRPRTALLVIAAALAVALPALALVLLLASPAHAGSPTGGGPPIPGSPLDAYNRRVAYDGGVHKIARLTALIAYTLMVDTVVLGVVLRMRYFQRVVNRATVYGAHMTLALSALIFGAVHGVTFLYQPIWRIGARELVIPFAGGVQRVPVGFGILGTELAVAVGCSIWAQQRFGYRRWLRVHQFAYPAFALVWLHVFTVHPEPRRFDPVALGVAAGAGACLLVFLIRVLPSRSRLRQRAFTTEVQR